MHVLVNNAGYSKGRPFAEIDSAEWADVLAAKLTTTFLCCRHALRYMGSGGSIVNIASGAGQRGLPNNAAYAAAKAGVIALSHSLAEECRRSGVRINVVNPRPIEGESSRNSPNRAFHEQHGHQPLSADEVVGAVVCFASDLSGDVTSWCLNVRNSNRW